MAETTRTEAEQAATRAHLEAYLESYPGLRGRVCRILLLHLHTNGLARIDDVYDRAERRADWHVPQDPNVPSSQLWAADEAEVINRIVTDLAARFLSPGEVDSIVWAAHQRDEAKSVEALARMPDVPLELIARKVSQFCSLGGSSGQVPVAPEGTLVALIRRCISDRIDYISIAKRHLTIQDLSWLLERTVSTEHGYGGVGGKAGGMLLAWAILRNSGHEEIALPSTVFLLTDAYTAFKDHNGLTELSDHKYQKLGRVRRNYRAIQAVFQNAEFPPRIANRLRAELARLGDVPLIVRSSSLLEDSFGAAFSGIYQSLFLINQGPPEERLRALLGAIAEIYSGVFSPHAVSYRRRHDLIDHDERMAVMIQPVVGKHYGQYYFPPTAGVAFSRNDFRWNRRIRREDGLLRLVLGLGTHAVDRVGDYARMVPLKAPTVRPEGTPEEVIFASQRRVDVLDLGGGGFTALGADEALDAMRPGGIANYVSIRQEGGHLASPIGLRVTEPAGRLVVTFDRLLSQGDFPDRIHSMLQTLEKAYRVPVDIEFIYIDDTIHILQCRPLTGVDDTARHPVPTDVPPGDQVFSARRWVRSGSIEDISHIVLVDPRDYDGLESVDARLEVGVLVGRLNELLAERQFLLMGPGRWGTQDVRLGVRVGFGDIGNARALIEIARTAQGMTPEPSFGTHFFQELVEAGISYLPLYPDDEGAVFNDEFLIGSPNALRSLIGDDADGFETVIRVIDVAQVSNGRTMQLVMDSELQEALCFLR